MDREERNALHDEIAVMALMQLEPEPDSFRPLVAMPDSFDRARQLFVNVFVAQALDQIESMVGNSKELIAERAADYARQGVDLAVASIEKLKVTLGLATPPARPSSAGPLMPN